MRHGDLHGDLDGHRGDQWVRFRTEETTAARLVAAVAEQAPLSDLAIVEPDIEDDVRRIYTGEVAI